MNDKRTGGQRAAGGGMALNDIYFVLFRHKWKIIILTVLGLATAVGIWFHKAPMYQSQAELLIKYVVSSKPQGLNAAEEPTREVDEGVINTEVAILSSFDLAMQVATNIGPSNILARVGGGKDQVAAANLIRDNLSVERITRSQVLRVTFSHPDPAIVQPVLKELIDDYQKLHTAIHGAVGQSYDSLMSEALASQVALHQTEDELRAAKSKAGILDIDDAQKSNSSLVSQKHEQILNAIAELDSHRAMLARLKGTSNSLPATTNTAVTATASTVEVEIPPEKIDQYNEAVDYLVGLKRSYYNLRDQGYSLHSKAIQEKQDQIDEATKAKKKLEQDEPRLAKLKTPPTRGVGESGSSANSNGVDLVATEEANVSALESRIASLQQQMKDIHNDAANLDSVEPGIRELERKRRNQEENWSRLMTGATTAKIEAALGASKNANIEPTQAPAPPRLEPHTKTMKTTAMVAVSGLVIGLVWAFAMELYFDPSVKRPKEIETDLGLRLFLSIPDFNRKGRRRLTNGETKKGSPAKGEPVKVEVPANGAVAVKGTLEVAPWDQNHSLHEHYEALRDRLISYFEVNNLTHKPKLVAVTGSASGCGTSTIAAGLAASISETGDGNVLLIDMNIEQGSAQQFYKGKPICELDDALAAETRDTAMVQDNLYVVNGRTDGDKLSRMLPKRFANLLPKLKASDYDYIIFDMPPVARTGVTQRLSGFMDMMLLVVESEKTSRDMVRQAGSLLNETKANVSVVLNKTRTYVPHRLHQEF